MRVVLYELKKIFKWKRVLAVLLLNILFYSLYISGILFNHSVAYDAQENARIELFEEMVEQYGLTLDETDILHFQSILIERIGDFEEELTQIPELVEQNVLTFEAFEEIMEWNPQFLEDSYWGVKVRKDIINSFESDFNDTRGFLRNLEAILESGSVISDRFDSIVSQEELSFFPPSIFHSYQALITKIVLICVINLIILISPLYIIERRAGMILLQYSTKLGRKLFCKKMIATTLAAIIVVSLHLTIYLSIYFHQHPYISQALNMNINSFKELIMWYDITLQNFIFLTIALVYLQAILFSFLSLFISRLSPNYLTVLGIQFPIAILILFDLGVFFEIVISEVIRPYGVGRGWRFNPPHLMPVFYLFIVMTITLLLFVQWKKEKKLDVLL